MDLSFIRINERRGLWTQAAGTIVAVVGSTPIMVKAEVYGLAAQKVNC